MIQNDFEKAYYEAESFWSGDMVQDPANKKRIELTASFVKPQVQSLVDVGCGNGVFLHYLTQTRSFSRLTGIERSETALRYVTTEKIIASIAEIPLDSASFDCVTCLEVLEHLPVTIYEQSIAELARISAKYIIISVPYNEILEDSYTQCPNCKTMFNKELHVRTYDDKAIKDLFASKGFECVATVTTGTGVHFKGHRQFVKWFYPETFKVWRSPVCPLCGYAEEERQADSNPEAPPQKRGKRKLISYVSALPKLFWPKEKKDYWIIALYEKK